MKTQTGADEQKVAGVANSQNAMTTAMTARLLELNGKAPTVDQIKKLSALDMNYLREEMKKHEGNIESDVDVECPHCGNQFKTEIEIGSANFFFPSVT
jgi:glycerate kinase